jgi:hypothetical protein
VGPGSNNAEGQQSVAAASRTADSGAAGAGETAGEVINFLPKLLSSFTGGAIAGAGGIRGIINDVLTYGSVALL